MKEIKICDRCGRAIKSYIIEDGWIICTICEDEGRYPLRKLNVTDE